MLKLPVAVRIHINLFFLLLLISGAFLLRLPARLLVLSPKAGEVLQGVIPVAGSASGADFLSYEVSFTYDREDSKTWFLIQQSNEPVQEGTLAVWDTTTITDGDYRLRAEIILKDGQSEELIVSGLKVRNYTPVEPQSTPDIQQHVVTATIDDVGVTPTSQPLMPTPLPENPAQITSGGLAKSLLVGLGVAAGIFLLLIVYMAVRSSHRRRR
ncbi:MAG: hypothetical protein IT308_00820 [Anaerolineaceae bacterium]|nr:hypothetical protein [Anaerolineaceae bacterium]